ncbi:hypothetical protein KC19_9G136500 [Ceratodon purpureus]|uniref:Secreted protein n=1 Tax=Ceratodon purpureus TaxID=3225 RepID=A0A8T0GRN3_CERPU|nr:hypothetical protein KC19_9G136500 [Ceratodon purpureus]
MELNLVVCVGLHLSLGLPGGRRYVYFCTIVALACERIDTDFLVCNFHCFYFFEGTVESLRRVWKLNRVRNC